MIGTIGDRKIPFIIEPIKTIPISFVLRVKGNNIMQIRHANIHILYNLR